MTRLRFQFEDSNPYTSGPISAKRAAYYLSQITDNVEKKNKNKVKANPKTDLPNKKQRWKKDDDQNLIEIDVI